MASRKGKQRRFEQSRRKRAKRLVPVDPADKRVVLPPGAVAADPVQLRHNNTYGVLPQYYVDKVVKCRQCGTQEVWAANRQKWWYEVAKGNINTQAVLCRTCREAEKERKAEARRIHLEGVARKRAQPKT